MALESTSLGWKVLGGILVVSATLNAIQVIVVDDVTIQILRATLSGVLLLLAFLCFRKGSTPSGGIRT
ncbi:MAG TPA: hypothetical protein VNN79_23185 [Actinomycetota bacterium]|nr:hypothetical protein [Actinomycetota bacterium]